MFRQEEVSSQQCQNRMYSQTGLSIGRSKEAFRIRRFMSKLPGVSFFRSAGEKGRTWEQGPGTLCKLFSSRSFSERLGRSEKAFWKRRFCVEVPWGVPFLFRRQEGTHLGTQGTYHLKLLL